MNAAREALNALPPVPSSPLPPPPSAAPTAPARAQFKISSRRGGHFRITPFG